MESKKVPGEMNPRGAPDPVTAFGGPEDVRRGEEELARCHAVQGGHWQVNAWEPFPVDALPEPVRRIVVGAAAARGCDESYVALPLLSLLAGVIGNSRSVRIQEGWDQLAVIWTAVVGESGTLKTPALEGVLRPLQRRQEQAELAHDHALAEYAVRKDLHRVEYSAWRRRARHRLAVETGSVVAGLLTEPQGATTGLLEHVRPAVGGSAGSGDPRRTEAGIEAGFRMESRLSVVDGAGAVVSGTMVSGTALLAGHLTAPTAVTGGFPPQAVDSAIARIAPPSPPAPLPSRERGEMDGTLRQRYYPIPELPPALPRRPVCRQYFASDATLEELAVILLEDPRGILLARDELAGWFASFDSPRGRKGGALAGWLSLFNSLPLVLRRKGGNHAKLTIPCPVVSITGGIQPESLKSVRDQTRSGLLQRFLLAYPPVRDRPWVPRALNPALDRELDELISKLEQLEPDPGPRGQGVPRALPLTPEANGEWIGFYRAWAICRAQSKGVQAAMFSKTECYGARLALVIHLVRAVLGKAAPEAIDRDSMHRGTSLARWFAQEAARIQTRLDGDCHPIDRNNLVDWIRQRGGSVTVRDLMRGPREYRTQVAAEAGLRALAEAGMGKVRVRKGKKGPPLVSFELWDNRWRH